jgi:7-cyano-7-deazaguanine synthase
MSRDTPHPRTGLLLSGGLDSAILAGQLLDRGWHVVPIYVRSGCVWEQHEIAAVRRFLSAIDRSRLDGLIQLDLPLADLYGDHWSITGLNVPDDTTPDHAVFMPGRNPLMLIKPVLWCQMHGIGQLALATLANNPFVDATTGFFASFEEMIHQATGGQVQIARPFARMLKRQVMELGRHLPLELTFSCLAPVDGLHCGLCNKCAERHLAFRQLEIDDPTRYCSAAPQHRSPVDSSK